MKHLSELVELIADGDDFGAQPNQMDVRIRELFELIRSNPELDAETAAQRMHLRPGGSAFRKVKHALKLALLNRLTALSISDRSPDKRKRAYAYVWKLIAIAKQLRTDLKSEFLLASLEEAYRLAEQHAFHEAAHQSAMMLRRQFANRRFDTEKYLYYRDRADHYRAMVLALKEATAELNEVFFRRNTQRPAHEIAQYARDAFDRHGHLVELYDEPNISYIVFLLELNIYLAVRDYGRVIEVANRALSYLDGRAGTLPKMIQVFEANLSVAYTQLNDYENGRAFALRLLERTGPDEHNYIKVYELLLLLSLRAGKFQEAYATFRSIHPATLRRDILSYYRETFRIIEAYLYLLIRLGKIEPDAQDVHFRNFRISRFLNSFRHATSEKSHRNVHLLIIEIIDNVTNERHGKTTYSIEAINKYAQRHLKGPGHERVRYFLKALSQLSVQQYHRTAVERHTSRYIQRMKQHRLEETKLDYYMELVPFETLWELILERLGFRRIRRSPKRGR
jgi:hypothetical protein